MKISTLKNLIIFLFITSVSFSVEADESGKIEINKVSINGICINSKEKDIYKILGKPDKAIEHGVDIVTNALAKTIYYSGLEIYLIHGEIYKLRCKGSICLTNTGIRIGYPSKAISRAYGEPKYKSNTNFSYIFMNNKKHTNKTFSFKLKNNKVKEILYLVDYT